MAKINNLTENWDNHTFLEVEGFIKEELTELEDNTAANTESIKDIAASGGASLASAVIFNDGGNAEQKVSDLSAIINENISNKVNDLFGKEYNESTYPTTNLIFNEDKKIESKCIEIDSKLNGKVDLDFIQERNCVLAYPNVWNTYPGDKCKIFKVKAGERYTIVSDEHQVIFGFLADDIEPIKGQVVPFVDGTRHSFVNETQTWTVPEGANYLVVNIQNNQGVILTPKSITRLDDIDTHLDDIDTHLDVVDTHLDVVDTHLDDVEYIISDMETPDILSYTHDDDYIKYSDVTLANSENKAFKYAIIPVTEDMYKVQVDGRFFALGCALAFKDENGVVLPYKDLNNNTVTKQNSPQTQRLLLGGYVPANAKTIWTSWNLSDTSIKYTFSVSYKTSIKEEIEKVKTSAVEVPEMTDVMMIPIFGQSLSIGAAAYPAISTTRKYKAGIMFGGTDGVRAAQKPLSYFTNFVDLVEKDNIRISPSGDSSGSGETAASGCAEKILEALQQNIGLSVYSAYWENHKILFVSCGSGSKTVADLTNDYLDGLKNAIQGAKNICDADNKTFSVPCWIWMQGETDMKPISVGGAGTSKDAYKEGLVNLANQINNYAKNVSGQENDVKCICYQIDSQNIWSTPKSYTNTNIMDVPTAQMELVRDNDMFIASTPVYVLDHSTAEPIHLNAIGEKMCGLYCGLAAQSVILNRISQTGLTPKSYEISGNNIVVKYNVPCPPMAIDDTWVKNIDNAGFSVLTSGNANIVSKVSVFDDTVTIECTESPLNAKLCYGYNGTNGKDGRLQGGRGNLRDSAGYTYSGEIAGKQYNLHNYAYMFVKLLDAETGNI